MCGIAGFTGVSSPSEIARFHKLLHHRGPDEHGELCNDRISLSHNRLAILDLKTGRQPIFNEDETCAIVFNGEIYNYRELRASLESRHRFRTETDTEVILHLYEEHGVDTPNYLRGDFAFCIWDSRDGSCFLSRDPLGVKPLFYAVTDRGELVFSSELRAILQHPDVRDDVDLDAVSEYLTCLYVSAPDTLMKRVRKLGAGESLSWKSGTARTWKYWSLPEPNNGGSFEDLQEQTLDLLKTAVKRRLIADVPVGAFLSGGLDSSLIVALASEHSKGLHTFSIGYGEPDFDELRYAQIVSRRYGTTHHEFVIQPRAQDLIEEVIDATDEPLADSSAIPTFLISRETRKHVKVVLSGIGGDEMFFGYPRYLGAKLSEMVPAVLRGMVANVSRFWSSEPSGRDIGGWIRRFGEGLQLDSARRYIRWTTFLDSSLRDRLIPDGNGKRRAPEERMLDVFHNGSGKMLDHVFRFDVNRYVASDLLQICDNMTMAHSLEARVPFCDVDLVNAMARIPASKRFPGYRLKPILREIGKSYLPDEILRRKKQGFMIPIGRWFRHDLRGYMEDQLASRNLPDMLDHRFVQTLWNQHLTGQENHTHVLWAILLLSRWLRKSRGKITAIR